MYWEIARARKSTMTPNMTDLLGRRNVLEDSWSPGDVVIGLVDHLISTSYHHALEGNGALWCPRLDLACQDSDILAR
jgi:hypothetical protein